MFALCGWFVMSTASAVARGADIDAALGSLRVGDVMDRDVAGVPPGLTLDTFADQFLGDDATTAVPVTRDGTLLGMLGARQVRGIRRIERTVEERDDAEAVLVQGYCAAVRSAITDDGRAPLAAAGLKLKQRLETVAGSLDRVQQKGASRRRSRDCTR